MKRALELLSRDGWLPAREPSPSASAAEICRARHSRLHNPDYPVFAAIIRCCADRHVVKLAIRRTQVSIAGSPSSYRILPHDGRPQPERNVAVADHLPFDSSGIGCGAAGDASKLVTIVPAPACTILGS
jgi:hypothetical protein